MALVTAPACSTSQIIMPVSHTEQRPPRVSLKEGKEGGERRRKQGAVTCQQCQKHSHPGSQGRAWLWVLVVCSAASPPPRLRSVQKASPTNVGLSNILSPVVCTGLVGEERDLCLLEPGSRFFFLWERQQCQGCCSSRSHAALTAPQLSWWQFMRF